MYSKMPTDFFFQALDGQLLAGSKFCILATNCTKSISFLVKNKVNLACEDAKMHHRLASCQDASFIVCCLFL